MEQTGNIRWLLKKCGRIALTGAWIAARRAPADCGVRIITYHRFGSMRRAPFRLSGAIFETQIAFLANNRLAVSLFQVESWMRGEVELPNNSVLVTIDDGDPSVYDLALPILRQYEVPAVLYTLAGSVPGFPVMSDEHIKSVHRAGITIGSHGLTHRSMAQLSLADARHELVSSKHRLESLIGVPVTSFAYPFGTKSHVSWDVVQLAIEAGYTTAVTSVHGRLTQQQGHPLLLPRVKIEAGDPNWLFEHLCRGSMDWWRLVDEGPFRRLSGVGDGHFVGAR